MKRSHLLAGLCWACLGPAFLSCAPGTQTSPLERTDPAAELREAVRLLGAPAFDRREEAAGRLRRAGAEALPSLRAALNDPDLEVGQQAARLVVEIETAVRLGAFLDADPEVRENALDGLIRERGEKGAMAFLKENLRPGLAVLFTDILFFRFEADLRGEAVNLLGEIGPPASFPGLLWALRDHHVGYLSEKVRDLLVQQGDPSILADLDDITGDGAEEAREVGAAVRARHPDGKKPDRPLTDREAILREVREGKRPGDRVRALCAVATGLYDRPGAGRAAAAALADPEPQVRRWAARAFTYLPVEGFEKDLMETAGKDSDSKARIQALMALARSARAEARDFLVSTAASAEPELRRAAISALGDFGDEEVARKLEGMKGREKEAGVAGQIEESIRRIRARLAAEAKGERESP